MLKPPPRLFSTKVGDACPEPDEFPTNFYCEQTVHGLGTDRSMDKAIIGHSTQVSRTGQCRSKGQSRACRHADTIPKICEHRRI